MFSRSCAAGDARSWAGGRCIAGCLVCERPDGYPSAGPRAAAPARTRCLVAAALRSSSLPSLGRPGRTSRRARSPRALNGSVGAECSSPTSPVRASHRVCSRCGGLSRAPAAPRPNDGSGSVAAATRAGAAKRITCPPNAIAHNATQVQPITRPPIESVSQCTPNTTREQPTATARATAAPARNIRRSEDPSRPSTIAIAAKVAAAAVVCPLGNDGPEKPAKGRRSGRARCTASLMRFESSSWPRSRSRGTTGSPSCASATARTRR